MTQAASVHRAFLAALFAHVLGAAPTGAPPGAHPGFPGGAVAGALDRAAAYARARAIVVLPLGVQAATDARELASLHAAIALQSVRHGRPLAPTLILSAGPVLHKGGAAGAADFLLALALSLDENAAIHAGACGPAPVDAPADYPVGCLLAPDTMHRALALGLQPGASLLAGQAQDFFAALGDRFCVAPAPGTVLRAVYISVD